jgi:hypothetical protein
MNESQKLSMALCIHGRRKLKISQKYNLYIYSIYNNNKNISILLTSITLEYIFMDIIYILERHIFGNCEANIKHTCRKVLIKFCSYLNSHNLQRLFIVGTRWLSKIPAFSQRHILPINLSRIVLRRLE